MTEDAGGEEEQGLDEGQDCFHQDADDAERDREQVEEWPENQNGQGQRPAEDEQDRPQQEGYQGFHCGCAPLTRQEGVGIRKSDVGGRRSDIGYRISEVGGRKTEGGGQRSDDSGQKTEVRCQRSGGRGQKAEVGGRRSEVAHSWSEEPRLRFACGIRNRGDRGEFCRKTQF